MIKWLGEQRIGPQSSHAHHLAAQQVAETQLSRAVSTLEDKLYGGFDGNERFTAQISKYG